MYLSAGCISFMQPHAERQNTSERVLALGSWALQILFGQVQKPKGTSLGCAWKCGGDPVVRSAAASRR